MCYGDNASDFELRPAPMAAGIFICGAVRRRSAAMLVVDLQGHTRACFFLALYRGRGGIVPPWRRTETKNWLRSQRLAAAPFWQNKPDGRGWTGQQRRP